MAASAGATMLVGFDFDAYDGSAATAGSTVNDAGVSPATISRGSGLQALGTASTFGSYGAASNIAVDNGLDLAITHGDYVSFTVAPVSGQITITDVAALGFWREGVNGGLAALESDVTGFGASASNILGSQAIGGDFGSPLTMTYPLATPIVSSTPVELRLYFYAYDKANVNHYEQIGLGNASNGTDAVIDLAVNGSAGAVPEPASLGVVILGGVALAARRRFRSR